MRADTEHRPFRLRPGRAAVAALALAVTLVAGCESLGRLPGDWVHLAGREFGAADATEAVVAYHRAVRGFSAAELERERATLALYEPTPINRVRQAITLAHPEHANGLGPAIELLDTVIAAEQPDARALHPIARLLVDQLREREQLQKANEALAQRLEESGRELEESRRSRARLQEKLDALTEIERTLPARPPAGAAPAPANPERRNGR